MFAIEGRSGPTSLTDISALKDLMGFRRFRLRCTKFEALGMLFNNVMLMAVFGKIYNLPT